MRRALLLTGVAAGVALIFTTAFACLPPTKEQRIKDHFDKVRELAFCQKAYEIASSFPSYASRSVIDLKTRKSLLKQSDVLEEKSRHLNTLLDTDLKDQAVELGVSEVEYDAKLDEIKAEAEVSAVEAFKQAEEPQEVLDQLNQVYDDCVM